MNSIFASCSMGSARSTTVPSSAIATVRFASDGEMPLATSKPVMFFGNSRLAPSGKVRAMRGSGSTGFKLATLYWNPAAGAFLSGISLSCGSLLRTSAGKRERGGLVAQVPVEGNGDAVRKRNSLPFLIDMQGRFSFLTHLRRLRRRLKQRPGRFVYDF